MSGFEIAGVVLAAFPLILSGIGHWRDAAKVGGFFWRVRTEYKKCERDVQFEETCYKRTLRKLLLPIVKNADEVERLMNNPDSKDWNNDTLQEGLKDRLEESYDLYMAIICDMKDTIHDLKKELCFDDSTIQSKLAPQERQNQRQQSSPVPPSKSSRLRLSKLSLDYEKFRIKFSFNEQVRKELFKKVSKCNSQLEKLLSTGDEVSALEKATSSPRRKTSPLVTIFKNAWKQADLLFKALHNGWQCSCRQSHLANIRLEHRNLPETSFQIILMFSLDWSKVNTSWSWRELRCGQMADCSFPHEPVATPTAAQTPCLPDRTQKPGLPSRAKRVAFVASSSSTKATANVPVKSHVKLCQVLADGKDGKCMGTVGHDDETYHLHQLTKREKLVDTQPLTLSQILSQSSNLSLTRRQRYSIALLLASSVAQLQFTSWLKTGLTKEDVLFFPSEDDGWNMSCQEPFIRQDFPPHHPQDSAIEDGDWSFNLLGILLLELCFNQRLEDYTVRKSYPTVAGQAKQAFDLKAALKWSRGVGDEGGDDYASAVRWCFTGAKDANRAWRVEIIENVVRPLEICQEHFKRTAIS